MTVQEARPSRQSLFPSLARRRRHVSSIRPARLDDLEECLRCVTGGFAYDGAALADLLSLWRRLLQARLLHAVIMEDLEAPPGRRIFYFNFKVCLTPEYAHCLRVGAPPILARQIGRLLQNGESPLLTLDAVRHANGGSGPGLHVAALSFGAPTLLPGQDFSLVSQKVVEWGSYSTAGFRMAEYYAEFFGEAQWRWADGAGFHLRNDYSAHFRSARLSPRDRCPSPENAPRLYGATLAETQAETGTFASILFQWHPSRFFFKPAEQELLQWAMMDITDNELAQWLALAPITVQKRWMSIYERVAEAAPNLLGGTTGDAKTGDAKRGTEKKRRLLQYLRHHMEELRPHLPPKK